MASYTLKKRKILFVNDIDTDIFYAAKNVNSIVKIYHYLLQLSTNGKEVQIPSNKHLSGLFGVLERQIQNDLATLEDLGFIEIMYEIERPKDEEGNVIRSIAKGGIRNVGKRLGIKVDQKLMLEYMGYTRYDEKYKKAPLRGWFRRLVNQLPIELLGYFNHALACAQEANDQVKIEKIQKRLENWTRHVKVSVKRHKSYIEQETLEEVDQEKVIDRMIALGDSMGMILNKPPVMSKN